MTMGSVILWNCKIVLAGLLQEGEFEVCKGQVALMY